jgi:hypothetical protein
MAFLQQQPNRWNLAYAPNIYTVQFTQNPYEQPSDKLVLTVEIEGVEVARFKQAPNPAGAAHFDISRVLQSYLNPSFVESTSLLAPTPGAALTYQAKYGIENNGVTTIQGAAAVKGVLNGYTNWRTIKWSYLDYIPWPNFETCLCELPTCIDNAAYPGPFGTTLYNYLSNWPTTNSAGIKSYKVRNDEFKTLSFFNRIVRWDSGQMWGPNESPFFVKYDFYNSAGTLLETNIKTISELTGLPVRTDCNDLTTHDHTFAELVGTIGSGPQNLKNAGIWNTSAASYNISIYSINACYINDNGPIQDCNDLSELADYLGYKIYDAAFEVEDKCSAFEPITVSFMNAYGVKDYYTFDRRNTLTVGAQRSTYTKMLGSWNEAAFTIDPQGRGRTSFNTSATTVMQLSTDWMNDTESAWIEELFLSPSVNIYHKGVWEPVVITSSTYEQKTFSRDKMFQHIIEVQFANDKQTQRG